MKHELPGPLRALTTALMLHLASPMAQEVTRLVATKDWARLALLRADPLTYTDVDLFRRDYQAAEFLRKSPLLPLPAAGRRKKAIEAFEQSESECCSTNEMFRLLRHYADGASHLSEPYQPLLTILERARKIVRRILGPLPSSPPDGRFGPGSTYELRGSTHACALDKVSKAITTTADAAEPVLFQILGTAWGKRLLSEGQTVHEIVRGNRFMTVPKDALKDRGICIEPGGNVWAQLGWGGYMKQRLALVGLHVNKRVNTPWMDWDCPLEFSTHIDGQNVHQALACLGSLTGALATIDLSNASDTVCIELVRWLLPPDWYSVLASLRSPYTEINGRWVRLEKFSSMGNGYTFELETLLFAALAAAASGEKVGEGVYCYGDDIVVPSVHAPLVMGVLRACGFTPNERKSYYTGPFRESCGGDFYEGLDVRPCYADTNLSTPVDWIVLHNQIKAKWPGADDALRVCVEQIPTHLRSYGPEFLGDVVLHGPFTARLDPDTGIHFCKGVVPQTPKVDLDRWDDESQMIGVLLGVARGAVTPDPGPRKPRRQVVLDDVPVRGAPTGFLVKRFSTLGVASG